MNNFGLRLKEFRENVEMSQHEFAIKCGFKYASKISQYEKEVNKPKRDALEAIEKAFPKLNMQWLILGTGSMLHQNESIAEEPNDGYNRLPPKNDLISCYEKVKELESKITLLETIIKLQQQLIEPNKA
jgi:transcriptional regulator with XRE-family HTH domain